MFVVESSHPDDGLVQTLSLLQNKGVKSDSRNGPVLRFPGPLTVIHTDTRQYMVRSEVRRVNPYFSLFETIWMLAGRDDLAALLPYNAGFAQYSDNGTTVRGSAYGKRWRSWFGYDQLDVLIDRLEKDPTDRRCVLQMWDAASDFNIVSKDVPCNTNVFFSVVNRDGVDVLDMTVCNRSNDIVYGMFGSNVVHFSWLLNYVAQHIGIPPGFYFQIANNAHLYTDHELSAKCMTDEGMESLADVGPFPYEQRFPTLPRAKTLYNDAIDEPDKVPSYWTGVLGDSIIPMIWAHRALRRSPRSDQKVDLCLRKKMALTYLSTCEDDYIRSVCESWTATFGGENQKGAA